MPRMGKRPPPWRGTGLDETSRQTESTGQPSSDDDALSGLWTNAREAIVEVAINAQRGDAPHLTLQQFLDTPILQEIQDAFAAITGLSTTILDADGLPVTSRSDSKRLRESTELIGTLIEGDEVAYGPFHAPISIGGQRVGEIALDPEKPANDLDQQAGRDLLEQLAQRLGAPQDQIDALMAAADSNSRVQRSAAVQFLYLLADAVSQFCVQSYLLNTRVKELTALYELSRLLAGHRDVHQVLAAAVKSVSQVMDVKAALIGLLDEHGQLINQAHHNLSAEYAKKGPLFLSQSAPQRRMLEGEVVYVRDMLTDPGVIYKDAARREGLKSMLGTGMIYQGRPIGTIRLYTDVERVFNAYEMRLLKAVSRLLATAIETTRLAEMRAESRDLQRQMLLARDVQRRMLPSRVPEIEGLEFAARYVPCFELGGDFYDFIDLDDELGIVIGDVVGKGIAASLLMASCRATIRAYAEDGGPPDEVLSNVNLAMSRETLDSEFATAFYGMINPKTLKFRYCSAGHEPTYLLRDDEIITLDMGGPIVGVKLGLPFEMSTIQLRRGDIVVIYTDGLPDARNFKQQKFGRERVQRAIKERGTGAARDVVQHLTWEMRRFVGMNQNVDDTSIVAMKVT